MFRIVVGILSGDRTAADAVHAGSAHAADAADTVADAVSSTAGVVHLGTVVVLVTVSTVISGGLNRPLHPHRVPLDVALFLKCITCDVLQGFSLGAKKDGGPETVLFAGTDPLTGLRLHFPQLSVGARSVVVHFAGK